MDKQRRSFIKTSATTSAIGLLIAAGLLKPGDVLAAWPEEAFAQTSLDDALNILFGTTQSEEGDIRIDAPKIAEDGAIVPVTISTHMATVESVSLFVTNNPQPLICSYEFKTNLEPYISTRIKMDKTSDLIAVVKQASGKLYSAKRNVQVTKSGCSE